MAGRVHARVQNDRIKLTMAEKIMDEQGEVRAGRGCNDQIFAVQNTSA